MRIIVMSALLLLILAGCSGIGQPVAPGIQDIHESRGASCNHWLWGFWQFYIPADRSRIDVIPAREGDYHFCVTKFLKIAPCHDCLSVSAPEI